jgi:hypothetical protein
MEEKVMRYNMKTFLTISVCLLVLPLTGCTRGGLSGLAPAAGIVTLNGAPVEGATISFAPAAASSDARSASAMTGKDGKFVVTTLNYGDGMYPGEYQVFITKTTGTGGIEDLDSGDKTKTRDNRQIVFHLPLKYGDKNTSGLTVSIPPQGNKNIELKLEGTVDLTPRKPVDVKK